MLNPSTADATHDDPTIRRCIGFARRAGCGGLRVENLYALRETDPDRMFARGPEAVGDTDRFIVDAVSQSRAMVVAAWGADRRAAPRAGELRGLLRALGVRLHCLGLSKQGAPRHPLYLRKTAALIPLE